MGRCLLGTMETIIPLQAGKVEPPKNSTIQRHVTAAKILSMNVIGRAKMQASTPNTAQSSRATIRCLQGHLRTIITS